MSSTPTIGAEAGAGSPDAEHAEATTPRRRAASDRWTRLLVWGVWAAMVGVFLACVARYGRNVPLAEDWVLVPPLTGNEPDLAGWLWSQNNEHRLPLPRLVLLGLLKVTGDFRSGMVLNVVLMAALSGAAIVVLRRLRGRTVVADAFFPLALLHLGHWANLVWGWQLQFVLSTALVLALLLLVATHGATPRPPAVVAAGACLVLLPLTGANGLVFVPLLAAGLAWEGLRLRRAGRGGTAPAWMTWWLVGCATVAVAISGLYFVGWERPWWNASSGSDVVGAAKTGAKFLALGLGPAASRSWKLSVVAVSVVVLAAGAAVALAAIGGRGVERRRATGLAMVLGGVAVLAAVVGWGRPAGSGEALPERYVLIAVPALCAAYLALQLHGPLMVRRLVQAGLFALMVVLLPFNTQAGLEWRDWYTAGMVAVERDLQAGVPRPELAARHHDFLLHWNVDMLEENMEMLRVARIGPFRHMRPHPHG